MGFVNFLDSGLQVVHQVSGRSFEEFFDGALQMLDVGAAAAAENLHT